MQLYQFDEAGIYVGEVVARPDPRNPKRVLAPGNTTDIPPPSAVEHEVAVWQNGEWALVADHRGVTYWLTDGTQHKIANLGEVPPDAALLAPPAATLTVEHVNAERDKRIRGGLPVSIGGQVHVLDFDPEAENNITGAAALAGFALAAGATEGDLRWHSGDDDFSWLTQANIIIPVDAATMFKIGQAAAQWKRAHIYAARAIKDAPGGIPEDYESDAYWP